MNAQQISITEDVQAVLREMTPKQLLEFHRWYSSGARCEDIDDLVFTIGSFVFCELIEWCEEVKNWDPVGCEISHPVLVNENGKPRRLSIPLGEEQRLINQVYRIVSSAGYTDAEIFSS